MKKTPEAKQFQLTLVQDTFSQIKQLVQCQMRGAALGMAMKLFDEEVLDLCGKKFSHKGTDYYHRGGSDDGNVIIHGQRVSVKKPRVRDGSEEVQLQSYFALQDYEGVLDEITNSTGLKKSSVSKAFKEGSLKALEEINGRDLSKYEFLSVMIDGIGFGDRTVIAALGITTSGKKLIIGLREGDTENSEVCVDLLQSFFDRKLNTVFPILFVIDGSKALKKGIRKVFRNTVPIQRCVRHKERNIISYLPKEHHMEFRRRWKKLHGSVEYSKAKKEYDELSTWLSHINYAAALSLEESERDTLTVIKLKAPALLRRTLLSTNPLESIFSKVASHKARVKNWKTGTDQISRWAAVTLLDVEKRFHIVEGFKQIPIVVQELRNLLLETQTEVA